MILVENRSKKLADFLDFSANMKSQFIPKFTVVNKNSSHGFDMFIFSELRHLIQIKNILIHFDFKVVPFVFWTKFWSKIQRLPKVER